MGGKGNDTYLVDNVGDVISELKGGGKDSVVSNVSWTLGDNLENLTLMGTESIGGIGNQLANTILGNAANNTLDGGKGNDFLDGVAGQDNLLGGKGNDTLILNDFNGDTVNGAEGYDSLFIRDANQTIDLTQGAIKGIEDIKLNVESTLTLSATSVLALNAQNDTLTVDAKTTNKLELEAGWLESGLLDGYKQFTKDGATLLVDAELDNIQIQSQAHAYTISDAASAANVGSAFTAGVDEITIDFSGKTYEFTGINSINLSGFGVEDKLIIAQHDGALHKGTAKFGSKPASYIVESTKFITSSVRPGGRVTRTYTAIDRVFWDNPNPQATGVIHTGHASLLSTFNSKYRGTRYEHNYNTHTNIHTSSLGGSTTTTTFTTTTSTSGFGGSGSGAGNGGTIRITGLPPELPESQFVFV